MYMHERDLFTHLGKTFHATVEPDDTGDAPWDREDGHGPVSEWTTRAKRPGERVLCEDRRQRRYYDFQEACKIAKRDGWDCEPYGKPGGYARAVEQDFKRLRAWCNGEWGYVGIIVTDDETGEDRSLWGIESDSDDYHLEVRQELAGELIHEQHPSFLAERAGQKRLALEVRA